MNIFVYWSGVIISGFILGWISRALFVKCNSYRMLKRLTAYHAAEQRAKGADQSLPAQGRLVK